MSVMGVVVLLVCGIVLVTVIGGWWFNK